jgi:hypothetical protein
MVIELAPQLSFPHKRESSIHRRLQVLLFQSCQIHTIAYDYLELQQNLRLALDNSCCQGLVRTKLNNHIK